MRVTIGFYEMSVHILLLVFLAYWILEFPISFASERDWYWKTPEWFGFFYAHTIPEVFVSVEFILSKIRIEWKRYWIYFLAGLAVLILNIFVTLYHEQPYEMMDWKDQPVVAIPSAIAIFALQTFAFAVVWKT